MLYKYELTEWFKDKKELKDAVEQIEKYEGKGKGYCYRKRDGKWAVFTKGDLVETEPDNSSYRNLPKDTVDIL